MRGFGDVLILKMCAKNVGYFYGFAKTTYGPSRVRHIPREAPFSK